MRRALLVVWVGVAACGGGSTAPAPAPTPQSNSATFTITASGVGPKELTVPPGSRVLFVNNDSRPHNIGSDPHPDHSDCPEINNVGVLTPGLSRETANLNTIRTCGFHDHDRPTDAALMGRIVIR